MRGALLYQVGENRLYDLRPSIDARGNRYKESVVYQTVSLSSALVEGTMTGNKKVMCKVLSWSWAELGNYTRYSVQ